MESHMIVLAVILACVSVTMSVPAAKRREDLSHLVTLLDNLKDIGNVRQNGQKGSTNINDASGSSASNFPDLSLTDISDDFEDEESLRKGYLGKSSGPVSKRQGAWWYDYGLGGGRFGKRSYGDYGIGGGRFGRDVDHVDLSDGSDADMTS